jgi:hypothetical protein
MMEFKIDWWKVLLWTVIFLGCALFWFIGLPKLINYVEGLFGSSGSDRTETVYIHDTTVVERYHAEVKRDTVVKWYEKIIWKESEPQTVYYTKTDTVFRDRVKKLNVMLKVEKKKDRLKIFAYDQDELLLKEMDYRVGADFTAVSTDENVFVKSKRWYWNGIKTIVNYELPFDFAQSWENGNTRLEINTGINYMDKAGIEIGPVYDATRKEFLLKAGIFYKFK